jgi:hypothetical protein
MQKKSGTYYEKWVGRHASFPPRQSVKKYFKLILGATNQFKLECDVEVGAFPEPVIQWYKNAEIISKDTIQDIVITDKNEIEFVGMSCFHILFIFRRCTFFIFRIKLEKLTVLRRKTRLFTWN